MTVLGAVAQILFGWLFADRLALLILDNREYTTHLRIALIGTAFGFINQFFFVLLRLERRSIVVISLNLFSLITGVSIIIYFLLVLRIGLLAPVLGEAINQILQFFLLAWMCRQWIGCKLSGREIRVQFAFGIPMMVSGFLYYLNLFGDRFWLKKFCSLEDVGCYAFAARIGMLIQVILILPFGQIWTPVRLEMQHKAGAGGLFGKMLSYYLFIGMLASLALTLFSPEIVMILAQNPSYLVATKAVPLVICANLIYGMVSILDSGIIFHRKSYLTAIMSLVALLVNAIINMILVPRLGFMGSGISLMLSMAAFSVGIGVFSHQLFPIVVEWRRLVSGVGIFIFAVFLGLGVGVGVSVAVALAKIMVIIGFFVLFYRLVLDHSERVLLMAYLSSIYTKNMNRFA
jgi:O-antigen/teichoic acid export membrane protein